jgi:hypothetical protein
MEQAGGAAVFTGAAVIMTPRWRGGAATPEARLDPNRHGERAVNAAGGSVTKVTVRFTARPVIVRRQGAEAG